MSGYRQSSYDPNAGQIGGKPMRPYNKVQWLGVAFALAGLAVDAVYFAGRLGWIEPLLDSSALAMALVVPGIVLVNSRREPVTDPAPELAAARKRWLVITLAIVTAILGAALVIEFTGAN